MTSENRDWRLENWAENIIYKNIHIIHLNDQVLSNHEPSVEALIIFPQKQVDYDMFEQTN